MRATFSPPIVEGLEPSDHRPTTIANVSGSAVSYGLAAGHSNWILTPLDGGLPVAGSFGLYQSPNAFTEGGSWLEGVQAGYNWMLSNRLALGIEADGSFPVFPDPAGLTTGGISNFISPSFGFGTFSETIPGDLWRAEQVLRARRQLGL